MNPGDLVKKVLLPGASLLGFLGLVWLLLNRLTGPFDRSVSQLFVGLPSSIYILFSILCRTGNVEIELPLLLYGGIRLYRKDSEGAQESDRAFLILWAAILVLGTLLEHSLKSSLPAFSPGEPFQHDPLSGWDVFFPLHFHVHASFPSGHTFRALMILLFLRRFASRYLWLALLWAGGIMLGVIALGWHFTTDVIGSFLLVLAVSPFFLSSPSRLNNHQQK